MSGNSDIKKKTINAVIWNAIEKFLVKGSSFFISIVLARLLSPTDYGLIGMLTIFIALSTIFIESGFAKALIQKRDCTDVDYSTAFYSNLGLSLLIYVLLVIVAPWIADFYEEPQLCPILRILSINFVIGSFNIVQRAKLMAQMDFKSLAKINFIGVLAGGCVGILMASAGWGVWALVGQAIANTFIMLFLFPHYSKWKPICVFSFESFKKLFGFGSKLLITGTVATIVNNISTIAIGKAYKSDSLGYYTRATQFSEMIAYTVNDILGTVTFPVLSELQNERERMVAVYRKSLFYTTLIIFPIMVLMALLARPLVIVLLTEKWLPCVLLLQILCMARIFTPLSAINMNVLNAIGRPDLYMRIDLLKIPIILLSLAITIPISVTAIVIGNFITAFICFFINAYYPKKLFGYGAWEQVKDDKKIIFSIVLMSMTVILFLKVCDEPWVQLVLGGIIGTSVYVASCLLFNVVSLMELKSLIAKRKRK